MKEAGAGWYEQPMDFIRWVHIVTGVVALGAFWLPLAARKGSPVHRRAGWVYALAMWVAAIAAWAICAGRLLDDDGANDAGARFLAFVGLLAANGAGTGIRVLRMRSKASERASIFDICSSALLLVAAVALGGLGILERSILHLAFSALGVFLASQQLRYWMRRPVSKMDWWYAHMGNMLGACIGTVTAFLVVNVPRFGLQQWALYFWMGPGVLGGIAITLWTRYYRRRFEGRTRRPAGEVETPPVA